MFLLNLPPQSDVFPSVFLLSCVVFFKTVAMSKEFFQITPNNTSALMQHKAKTVHIYFHSCLFCIECFVVTKVI